MADQHNANIPALTNQVAADIPDIKENLEHHKDAFQVLFETWSDTDLSSSVIDSTLGFSDGTYTYDFPTNGIAAHSIIMLGTSSTIIWMYLNTAPSGWKVLTTGADMVLGIAGGTDAYNVNGGNPDSEATWTIYAAHNHQWYDYRAGAVNDYSYNTDGTNTVIGYATAGGLGLARANVGQLAPDADQFTNTAAGSTGSWRVPASVGKLFQLDTA